MSNNAECSSATTSNATPSSTTFVQDGRKFISVSKRRGVYVVADVFQEEVRVNIREYFSFRAEEEAEEEETRAYLYPSKKGVSLTVSEFESLCDSVEPTKKEIKRLNKNLKKFKKKQKSAAAQ